MKYTIASILLIIFATLKVVADLFGFTQLSAVAAVTNVSPAMKVFTAHKGYETYSSKFELRIIYHDGQTQTALLNSESYSGLKGPYNRRNVYGALIAYGPVLVNSPHTHKMWREMTRRAFCDNSSVLKELGFNNNSGVSKASINYLGQVQSDSTYPAYLGVDCV